MDRRVFLAVRAGAGHAVAGAGIQYGQPAHDGARRSGGAHRRGHCPGLACHAAGAVRHGDGVDVVVAATVGRRGHRPVDDPDSQRGDVRRQRDRSADGHGICHPVRPGAGRAGHQSGELSQYGHDAAVSGGQRPPHFAGGDCAQLHPAAGRSQSGAGRADLVHPGAAGRQRHFQPGTGAGSAGDRGAAHRQPRAGRADQACSAAQSVRRGFSDVFHHGFSGAVSGDAGDAERGAASGGCGSEPVWPGVAAGRGALGATGARHG